MAPALLTGGTLASGTGAGLGAGAASGIGAGAGAAGAAIPEMIAAPTSTAIGGSELVAGVPELGGLIPEVASGVPPASGSMFSTLLGKGLDLYTKPGQTIGGQIGKLMGNEKLGQQVGQVGQILASSSQKGGGDNRPPPAPPGMPGISVAQAPPMPGMGGQGGPSFHVNPQTGILEYS